MRIIETEGALNAVVIAMTQHQSVVNVQERGCGVLIYLGSQGSSRFRTGSLGGGVIASTVPLLTCC